MMKKITFVLLALMIVVTSGIAQPRPRNISPEDMAKRSTEQIKEAVNLNEKQEKQVFELNLETGKKMREMREETQGGGFEAMREKMGEVRAEQDKKMKEILTADQWKKYEAYRAERRAGMNQRRR